VPRSAKTVIRARERLAGRNSRPNRHGGCCRTDIISPMRPLLGLFLLLLSTAGASAQMSGCDQKQSRQEVDRLTASGTIISIDQFPPSVTVVVELRRWSRLSLDDKTALARNVECAIAGPSDTMLRTVIVRSPDAQELGRYANNQLTIPP
jgi:hypothetical protein